MCAVVTEIGPAKRLPSRLLAATCRYFTRAAPPATVAWQPRLRVALIVGLVSTLFAYHQLVQRGWLASDFEYDLRAARDLLQGLNPYNNPSSHFGLPYPFDAQFPYPLFAAMFAVPFTLFSSYVAGSLYVGCLSAVMAYAVTRDGWWRLSIFVSPCYFVAASVANWSPLLVASAFLPVLYPLAIVKPTLVAPIMVNYPSIRGYLLCVVMTAASLLVFPSWPWHWLSSVANQPGGKYTMPLLVFPATLVLVAAVWWRKRPARLLVMLAAVPQHPFYYDQLLLWLIPQTLRQSLALSLSGWAVYLLWSLHDPTFRPLLAYTLHGPSLQWTAPVMYLPAFILVAWQAREEARKKEAGAIRHRREENA
jgi:hypothetical protein